MGLHTAVHKNWINYNMCVALGRPIDARLLDPESSIQETEPVAKDPGSLILDPGCMIQDEGLSVQDAESYVQEHGSCIRVLHARSKMPDSVSSVID